jgi:hypothetical protein
MVPASVSRLMLRKLSTSSRDRLWSLAVVGADYIDPYGETQVADGFRTPRMSDFFSDETQIQALQDRNVNARR